uniref:Uncharacterized protein n=1 Tax=Avena sativa TaxID=4498 RepID=A0ACD5WGT4_AVESA
MLSRFRGRRASPPAPVQEDADVDFEVSYPDNDGPEEDPSSSSSDEGGGSDSSSSSSEEEDTDVEGGETSDEESDSSSSEEQQQQQESVAEGCGPSVPARVPGGAAAAERAAGTANCPVCMEPWTSEGAHRISCIPCGHVYGRSCLERWLTQRGNITATCPQCGRRFRHKDIINIFAPEVVVPNNDLEKELSFCREKVESLAEMVLEQGKLLDEIIAEKRAWQNHRSTDIDVTKRQKVGERSHGRTYLEPSTSSRADHSSSNSCLFVLQIIAFWCLVCPETFELSLFSMTSDSVVLQCNLPAPGWSCSADDSGSHHIYAGLQNGTVLVFDTRQPSRPLHSMAGLSTHLVHTLHSVTDSSGSRKVISASAIGPCMWDANGNGSRPTLLLERDDQRVCFSLARAPRSSDLLVASFRPKSDLSGDVAPSQAYLSQTQTPSGSGKVGHHTVITRMDIGASFAQGSTCYSNVSEYRMCKSAIIPYGNSQHLFAFGDESLRGVRTWQLPLFGMATGLPPHSEPIFDLRYAESPAGAGYLGCLSDQKLQVFRVC